MKPIKLTMTAFGPYKEKEVIQFSDLKEHKLFIISGNTGAGKTTLFDGICFALFGSASGEDRGEPRMMRSHFARDDTPTSVEFEFELQDRSYRILRQMPHVKEGNKSATGEKYEFYEQRGENEFPCVDRQIVSEINQKVKDLIGLTEEQFKQIVMLPQGEFRKLLTSETENKESILRKIFKTEPYQWFANQMKEKRQEAEKQHERIQVQLHQHINHIHEAVPYREASTLTKIFQQENYLPTQVISGMEEEAEYFQHQLEQTKNEMQLAEEKHEKMVENFYEAKQINQQFDQLQEKETTLQEMRKREKEIEDKKHRFENAEKAASLTLYDEYRENSRIEEQEKQEALEEIKNNIHAAVDRRQKAERVHETEQGKEDERARTVYELNRFEELQPTVENADQDKRVLDNHQKQIDKENKSHEDTVKELNTIQQEIDDLRTFIQQNDEETETLTEQQNHFQEKQKVGRTFRSYLEQVKANEELKTNMEQKQIQFEKDKSMYHSTEETWIKGQAVVLAEHLHDGDSCPVCGSTSHPNKAKFHEKIPTEEQFKQIRNQYDQSHQAFMQAKVEYQSKVEETKRLREEELAQFHFSTYNEAESIFNKLYAEAEQMKQKIQELEKTFDLIKQKRKLKDDKEKQLKTLQEKKEKIEEKIQEIKIEQATAKSRYEEKISSIPENLRIPTELKKTIDSLKEKKNRLEKEWNLAQQELSEARQMELTHQTTYTERVNQLTEVQEKRKKTENQFFSAIQDEGFSTEESYREALLSKETRLQLKQEINDYDSTLEKLSQQINDLKQALEGRYQVDLEAMEQELNSLKERLENIRKKNSEAENYLKLIKNYITKIKETVHDLDNKEKRVGVIADLHDMIRGNNNNKISFERYVQIEFLEQIIAAANERLYRITDGQFHLIRSDRQESRGKQSGLSLDVYDAYTGQNRDVKTLSGGEKFNASLSMALGMSDIIQSYQGGITINTMFIDEGFGSLDEESLHKVIDTLIDLQKSGRTIGVISHVQEMKKVFPAILEVSKTLEGYSQTRFLVS